MLDFHKSVLKIFVIKNGKKRHSYIIIINLIEEVLQPSWFSSLRFNIYLVKRFKTIKGESLWHTDAIELFDVKISRQIE